MQRVQTHHVGAINAGNGGDNRLGAHSHDDDVCLQCRSLFSRELGAAMHGDARRFRRPSSTFTKLYMSCLKGMCCSASS